MGSVNRVILLGNVGRDPEIRNMQNGQSIANLSIATSESWKDKRSGERVEKTEWHRVSVFNPNLVRIIQQYVQKGTRLYIEGEVRTRKWTDQQGEERFTTEIVLSQFGGKMNIESGGKGSDRNPRSSGQTAQRQDDLDSEIPF